MALGWWLGCRIDALVYSCIFQIVAFMGSGSVIHAVHTNEMTEIVVAKKIPITAWTMFIACLAIAGAGIHLSSAQWVLNAIRRAGVQLR